MLPPSCAAAGAPDVCSWFGDSDPFPFVPTPELLRRVAAAGGYLFTMEPLALSDDGAESEGLAVFPPAGWFHWLVGDAPAASPSR